MNSLPAAISVGQNFRNMAFAAPFLTLEEEQMHARAVQDNNCPLAARKLVESHFRFVASMARRFAGYYKLDCEDLIQQGCIGLLTAVKKFCPTRYPDIRFVTYAKLHIKSEIVNYVLDNVRSFRMATTKSQRKLFFNIGKYYTGEHRAFTDEQIALIAVDLGVSTSEVRIMESKLRCEDAALDGEEGELILGQLSCNRLDPAHILEEADYEANVLGKIQAAVGALDERSQNVVYHRLVAEEKRGLKLLAQDHGVSAERIRQIENQAVASVRRIIKEAS